MTKHLNQIVSSNHFYRIKKLLLGSFLLGIFLSVVPTEDSRANEPLHDPWYYVDYHTYKFSLPDKLQHFYGSAMLTEVMGPMPALALGMTKEYYDDQYAGVGFSVKDIAADVLGIISAKFARTESVKMWLDWDPGQETLVLRFGLRI